MPEACYSRGMMDTQQQYNKIQQFIKQHYLELSNSGTVVVKTDSDGYRVGNYQIVNMGCIWQIRNTAGAVINELRQRRLAILTAALLCKKKYKLAQMAACLDQQYDIYTADKGLYEQRSAANPDNYTYKHRLNRVSDELDQLNSQIYELEKSACLQ